MGKAIGIFSLKGGVGKTSIVVSLGDALASFGKRVLLIDGNLSAPNLGMHLNLIEPEVTLHHVLSREKRLNDAIYNVGNMDVIPATIFSNKRINPLTLRNKVNLLKKKYDVILIDSPPSLSEEALATIFASDEMLAVATPDHPTISSTMKAVKRAKQRGVKISGIVLNKIYNKNFELDVEDIEKVLEVPILAMIPHDRNMLRAVSSFIPYTSFKPRSEGSTEFRKLAGILIGRKHRPFSFKNFFKLNPRKSEINREIFYERVFR